MITVGLLVQLEAKQGREADLEAFLKGGLELVQNEPATTAWFAMRLGASTFGIFDVFPDEAGRQAHLSGKLAVALMESIEEDEKKSIGLLADRAFDLSMQDNQLLP